MYNSIYYIEAFFAFMFIVIYLVRRIKKSSKERDRQFISKKEKKRKKYIWISFFLVVCIFNVAVKYFTFYQERNLAMEDSNSIVEAHYLLENFEQQVKEAKNQKDNQEIIGNKIRSCTAMMASYGTKRADASNSEEGKLIINRYYNGLKQLGVNASIQNNNFYGDTQLVDSFLEDIKETKELEKKVLFYYKIDENIFD